jgi:hypothetical protein
MGIHDLPKIRVKRVQTILSKDKVVANDSRSGLWPKVVLELNGKEKKVSLPNFHRPHSTNSLIDENLQSGIGAACMRLVGIKVFKDKKLPVQVRTALLTTLGKLRMTIVAAMDKAAAKEPLKTRFTKIKKSVRSSFVKKKMTDCLRSFIHREEIQLEELTGNQMKEIWDSLRNVEIARQVMET